MVPSIVAAIEQLRRVPTGVLNDIYVLFTVELCPKEATFDDKLAVKTR